MCRDAMDYTAIVRVLYLAGQHETDSFGKRVPLDSLTLGQVNERKEMMNHSSHIERLYGRAIADVWELATAVGYNLHQSIFDLGPLPVGIDWSAVFASRGGTAASPGANTGSTPTSQTPPGCENGYHAGIWGSDDGGARVPGDSLNPFHPCVVQLLFGGSQFCADLWNEAAPRIPLRDCTGPCRPPPSTRGAWSETARVMASVSTCYGEGHTESAA